MEHEVRASPVQGEVGKKQSFLPGGVVKDDNPSVICSFLANASSLYTREP